MGSVSEAKWIADNISGNMPMGLTTPVTVQYAQTQPQPAAAAPAVQPVNAFASLQQPALMQTAPDQMLSVQGVAPTPQFEMPGQTAMATMPAMQLQQAPQLAQAGLPLQM